jgi:hypothetical protein
MSVFKTKAMVHSLNDLDEVNIISEDGPNNVVAEYKGKRCTAIFNPFSGLYYVDDVYGVISDSKEKE